MKQHVGEILEKAIRQSQYPISKIAKQIGYTRQHMYNLFNQAQIDLNLIDEIGKIIHYDFTLEIKRLKKYSSIEPGNKEKDIQHEPNYKDKYLFLLEEYALLLKEHNKLLKKK
jgi:hypothetical protein